MPFLACLFIVFVAVILFGFIPELHHHFPEEVEGVGVLLLLVAVLVWAAWGLYIVTN